MVIILAGEIVVFIVSPLHFLMVSHKIIFPIPIGHFKKGLFVADPNKQHMNRLKSKKMGWGTGRKTEVEMQA